MLSDEDGLVKECSDVIVSAHQRLRRLSSTTTTEATTIIVAEFRKAYHLGILDRVKHSVNAEEDDFLDLTNLIADLPSSASTTLLSLFALPPRDPFSPEIIVISDLDNTAVENPWVAPVHYRSGDVIPGYLPLIRALTNNFRTVPIIISARPAALEQRSIQKVKRQFEVHHHVSPKSLCFQSGTLPGTLWYGLYRSGVLSNRGTNYALENAVATYAQVKFQAYQQLQHIFPHAAFVFFGDDTQGDYRFACELVKTNPKHLGIIRRIATNSVLGSTETAKKSHGLDANNSQGHALDPKIWVHTSYYEIIHRLLSTRKGWLTAEQIQILQQSTKSEFGHFYRPSLANGRFENPTVISQRDSVWLQHLGLTST